MILIGVAWLLIVAIAFYQSIHGLFSAVIMALLTTICAVVALGSYESLGRLLYAYQPSQADALALTIWFVIPLLVLRVCFDKLITGNAPLSVWADRIGGGVLGLYIGVVMVGILTIMLQMLPWGRSVLGYTPYDASLQRADKLYCDDFAIGVFKAAAGLASDRPFAKGHDNLSLELFCARNTAGLNGRIDTTADALTVAGVYKPGGEWTKVTGHGDLPKDPTKADDAESDVLIVEVKVSDSSRSARKEDGWYRLPATHFRLVTGSGASLYPLGYITLEDDVWLLHPAEVVDGKAKVADLCVLRRHETVPYQEIFWVYRLPKADTGENDYENTEEIDPDEALEHKEALENMYAPDYMVFRRTAVMGVNDPGDEELLPGEKDDPAATQPTTAPATQPATTTKPTTATPPA
jgi:hypothetical protein